MAQSPTFSLSARVARIFLVLAGACALGMTSACGSDSPTGPTNVPGTYVLRSVDADPLPFTVPNGRDHLIIVNSVTATLNANDTYAIAGTGTEDGNASTVVTDEGTFTQSGSTLHFTSTTLGGSTYDAKAKTDSFTVTLPGGFLDSDNESFALLFERQTPGSP
jgi:hypothetical protein